MPTYEYQCQKCQRKHEIFQSITAKPVKKCPRCGGRLKRLLGSGSGFLFRGSGFYITDYRSKGYKEAKKREESSSSSGSSSSASPSKKDSSAD
jgi:putative FmdB family regulatory protein